MSSHGVSTEYRSDIDGLRGVAVLAVVLYHAFPAWIRGGFIGVDIFFVISGFLISRAIWQGLEAGTFRFADFYARRVRRIFPALCVVLITCGLAGWYILTPSEYRRLGEKIASGTMFLSNFYYWHQTGYFDGGADTKPLLHLWSLAIEEQFYILWPLFLAAAWRLKARLVVILAAVFALSFATNIVLTNLDPVAAFYFPVSRFWELMTGAILAYATLSRRADALLGRQDGRAVTGALLMVAGFLVTTKQSAFPGWHAILPTLGAGLLISAPGAWLNRRVLSSSPLRIVGIISYPLYLWHWPVLYLVRFFDMWYQAGEYGARGVAIGVSIVLSTLTYLLIEKPIRFGMLRRYSTAPIAVLMSILLLGGVAMLSTDGFSKRDQGEITRLARFADKYPATEWRDRSCFLGPKDGPAQFAADCEGSNKKGPLVFLWGDSYAASLYPGLKALEDKGQFRVAQFTASTCPPLIGSRIAERANCWDINNAVMERIARLRPHTVLLGARWSYRESSPGYDFKYLTNTVAALKKSGVQRVIVVGPMPQWQKALPSLLPACSAEQTSSDGNLFSACGLAKGIADLDLSLQAFTSEMGVDYVSPYQILCDTKGCLTVIAGDAVSSYDVGHLSPEGSRFLMAKLATQLP